MYRLKYFSTMMLMTFFLTNFISAQGNDVKTTLKILFEQSKAKSYEKAAELIAYNGEDKTRLLKDSYNAANKDELNSAKRECKKISSIIELSSKYDIGNTIVVNKNDSEETASIDVTFLSADQKLIKTYTFIKTEKGYLLFNMN